MIKSHNKIIIVDNRREHLEILSKPFHDNGIGCKTYEYDVMFNTPIKGIRIAFFDINLNDISNPENNRNQIYATLADAIRTYISWENEPFALVFWTSNKDLINEFKEYIHKRKESIPKPFLVTHIDKDEFIGSKKDIGQKISEILSNEKINLLFDFGNHAAAAADNTINEIYKIIPQNDPWGNSDEFIQNFDKVFSKIAESTLGIQHARGNPTKAVYSALIPMMNYHLNNSGSLRTWDSSLTSLANAKNSADLIFPDSFDFRKLNTVFHLEEDVPITTNKGIRGIALKYNITSPCPYFLFITKYFISLEKETRKYFDLFVQFDSSKSSPEEREMIRGKSELFVLEMSAACDYSQNKNRLNKYVLGLITPVVAKEKMKEKSESVLLLPEMSYKEKALQIRLNFNHVFGTTLDDKILGDPLFILKGNILDKISTLYANHISRIGITSFE